MSEQITKLQRWLDLIAYLVGRRLPVPAEELMENVPAYAERWRTEDETACATARRTFERDKDELRRFGIPLQTVRYSINYGTEQAEGYRIDRRDFYLPYLRLVSDSRGIAGGGSVAAATSPDPVSVTSAAVRQSAGIAARHPASRARPAEVGLTEEEAKLSLDALRRAAELPSFPLARAARSAFRKLGFDLDPAVFATGVPVLFLDQPDSGGLGERLGRLSDALVARKRVRFRYHGIERGRQTERDVAAYGLLFQNGHWYLVGHDGLRNEVRVFRVERMDDVEVNARRPSTPDYDVPSDFRLDAHLARTPWELGHDEQPLRAEILFRFPVSLWAERNGHGELVERHPDGAQLRSFPVRQAQPFLRWLLALEGDVDLVSPSALRESLRRLALEVAAVHDG